jgi:hypothetical protein
MLVDFMRPWLNWIEHQISALRVEGSNPSGRTIKVGVFNFNWYLNQANLSN